MSDSNKDGLPPESSLGYQVSHLGRLLGRELRTRLEPFGVVPGQFAQLLELYESDGLTQAELCARVHIEQPTMASTLDRMQRDGLITRRPDPADRRRALVWLTDRAHAMRAEVIAAAVAGNAAASRGIPPAQAADFMRTLATMITNLTTGASEEI